MNKAQLRDDFIAKGWVVSAVNTWTKVSDIDGVVKYDVGVVSLENNFEIAQVKVVDDGGVSEIATALGAFKDAEVTFQIKLRIYLDTIEQTAGIFAISVVSAYADDSIAVCRAYSDDGSTADYVVK